jgi:protein SCO1/2
MVRMPRPAALLLALLLAACAPAPLAGTDLQKREAPDFTLTDGPTGDTVSLSALRGRVVVLTFLYTRCPDVCPLTAEKLRQARTGLGAAAEDLRLLAVSVDPAGDTPSATREFVRGHRLEGALRFLVGDRATLARVWAAYGIATESDGSLVGHNDALYLIDKQGRLRSLLHSDVDAGDLAASLRTLLGESRLF